ncbi:MAG: ABC transporter substrate-binding protein [Clostridiaceae bacterium]|nr:ABC transporter substrate-binding protein [Clostridiaceae bacterium]
MKKTSIKTIALLLILFLGLALGAGCAQKTDSKTLRIGASVAPHAEILRAAVPLMEAKGFKLEIKEFDNYVMPNTEVNDGNLEANYFQHTPYLLNFNKSNNTNLVGVAKIHYEPFAIYAGKTASLADLKDGATIAVPNDDSNEARALMLLEAAGLIKLKPLDGFTATVNDVAENPHNYKIEELEAALLPRSLADVDLAVINGNYALSSGIDIEKLALKYEDASSKATDEYANVIAVKAGNEKDPRVVALVEVLQSQEIRDFIKEKYGSAVVAVTGK